MKNRALWSIVLALAPTGIITLLILALYFLMVTSEGDGAMGIWMSISMTLYFGIHIVAGTSSIGFILALGDLVKTNKKIGWVGFSLNIILLACSVVCLTLIYHSPAADSERLRIAATLGNTNQVKKLLDKGYDVNSEDNRHNHILCIAIANHNQETAEFLIHRGADVNLPRNSSKTPLHAVASWGENSFLHGDKIVDGPALIDLLIEHGADIEAHSSDARSYHMRPLHCAAQANNTKIIDRLIYHGADINAEMSHGYTPLCQAAEKGTLKAAQALVRNGADLKHSNYRALQIAAANAKPEIIKFFIEAGADIHSSFALYSACENRTASFDKDILQIIDMLLEAGVDVNQKNQQGDTALHATARFNNPERATYLLTKGAQVNAVNNANMTPLYVAVQDVGYFPSERQKILVEILMNHGANIDIAGGQNTYLLEKYRTQGRNEASLRRYMPQTPLDLVNKWKVETQELIQFKDDILKLLNKGANEHSQLKIN